MVQVDPNWWQTLFDEVYLLTDARSVCDDELTLREADFIQDVLELKPGQRILDMCGGHGRHSLELSRRGLTDLTVLDYSPYLVRKGKRDAQNQGLDVLFIQGDARCTCFDAEWFDVVMILGNSFGYFHKQDQDKALLSEARRVLATGGKILLDLVDGEYLKSNFKPHSWHEIEPGVVVCRERVLDDSVVKVRELVLCKKEGLVRDQTYSARLYSSKCIKELLEQAGFDQIDLISDYSSHDSPGDYGFMTNRMLALAQKL